uniref:Guided entry of tail-anchored proteins factor 1 n=1 Tax=Panagrellus redivivus TaxID=6233 RepID=A0A7E4VKZ9_PANRE
MIDELDVQTLLEDPIDHETLHIQTATIDMAVALGIILLKLVSVIAGVAAFGISAQMIDFDVEKVLYIFYRKTEAELEVERMAAEIAVYDKELACMSEMDEFAKFHRKKRVRDRLFDEYTAKAGTAKQSTMYNKLKLNIISRVIIFLLTVFFSYVSRDIVIAEIPTNVFWPFNFLLTFPWVFASSVGDPPQTPVTLFNFCVLFSITYRAFLTQSLRNKVAAGKKSQ